MAVCGSLGRRSSLENWIRVRTRAPRAPARARRKHREDQETTARSIVVQVVEVEEKDDSSRGAGQGSSEQATSNTDVTSQHQPKLRRDPIARTRHIRLRQRLPGHPGRYSLPRSVADRGRTAPTTVSATTVSATTGGCPTIGAPHPEHTRAVAATSRRALTTPHLGDDGLWIGPRGWCWLDRYELEGHASEVLSLRSPTVCWTPRCRHHRDSSANPDEPDAALRLVTVARWTLTVRPTCTPRAGPCARSLPSWAFTATTVERAAPPCRRHHASGGPPLIPPPHNRSLSSVTKA